jgi:hypothetical protein
MHFQISEKDLILLGKLDTDEDTYERILLEKVTPNSDKWKEADSSTLDHVFRTIRKGYYSDEDTKNFLNSRIKLICNCSLMALNEQYLKVARYYHNVLISYNPHVEEHPLLHKIAKNLGIKKHHPPPNANLALFIDPYETYLGNCWDVDKFKGYEEAFRSFNLNWKNECKKYITNLEYNEQQCSNIYVRLKWVFKKLEELNEIEELEKNSSEIKKKEGITEKFPRAQIDLLNLFKPFVAYCDEMPIRLRSSTLENREIDPKESIRKIRAQLKDENIDSALERYNLVKKLIQLENVIMCPTSLDTSEELDPISFQKRRLELLRQGRNAKLKDFRAKYGNLDEFRKSVDDDSCHAEQSDSEKIGDSPFATPRDNQLLSFAQKIQDSDLSVKTSTESEMSRIHREQPDPPDSFIKHSPSNPKKDIEDRLSWLDLGGEGGLSSTTKRKLSNAEVSPRDRPPVKLHRHHDQRISPRKNGETQPTLTRRKSTVTFTPKPDQLKNLRHSKITHKEKTERRTIVQNSQSTPGILRKDKGKEKIVYSMNSDSSSSDKESTESETDRLKDLIRRDEV